MEEPTWGRTTCLSLKMSHNAVPLRLLLLILCFPVIFCDLGYGAKTYEELFKRGVDAYLAENWYDCIALMHKALETHKTVSDILAHCRSKCREESESPGPPVIPDDIENLQFFAKTLRNTLCIMKCEKKRLGDTQRNLVPRYIEEAFDSRVLYDYMQLCYYKIGNIQQAASCAYTFLAVNPEHEVMRGNLQFYASNPDLDVNKVKNLETRTFQELYLMGNDAYNKQKYHEVMHYFEAAIEEYYQAEEKCRLLCEGPFDQNGFPEFILSIANHFAYVIKCKQKCADKLSFMYGENYDNYVSSHFHYLQFAYFKVGEIRKACEAVATYLLFHPEDETMNHNMKYYMRTDGITKEDFHPSEEAVKYIKRDKYEKALLKFIQENYKFEESPDEKGNDQKSKRPTADVLSELLSLPVKDRQLGETESEQKQRLKKRAVDILKWSKENGIEIIMDEKKLNGTKRFMADGLATQQQCDQLIELASAAAVNGDGYNGKPSPHTEFESFEGLTVGRAAMLVKLGVLDLDKAHLFIQVSEKGRDYVEKYFNLNRELYFSYTHLVCRTALETSSEDRSDLSHPVHADNCLLQSNGDCLKQRPAYTWRDYSAIIYLNDDFVGGEFIFAQNKSSVQAEVKPKCGRLVGFSAGKENLHGVQAVFSGRRCALAMWYTLDRNHREKERELAQQVLEQIQKEEKSPSLKPPTSKDVRSKSPEKSSQASQKCKDCDKKKVPPKDSSSANGKKKSRSTGESKLQSATVHSELETDTGTNSDTKSVTYREQDDEELTNKFSLETFDGYSAHNHKDL